MDLSDGSDGEEAEIDREIDENDLLGGSDDEDQKILFGQGYRQQASDDIDLEDNDGDYLDLATGDDDELNLQLDPSDVGRLVAPVKVRIVEKPYKPVAESVSTIDDDEDNNEEDTIQSASDAALNDEQAEDEGGNETKSERSRFHTERTPTKDNLTNTNKSMGSPITSLGFKHSGSGPMNQGPRFHGMQRYHQPRNNMSRPHFLNRPGILGPRPPRLNGEFRGRFPRQVEPLVYQFQEGIFMDFSDHQMRKQMPHLMPQPPPPRFRCVGPQFPRHPRPSSNLTQVRPSIDCKRVESRPPHPEPASNQSHVIPKEPVELKIRPQPEVANNESKQKPDEKHEVPAEQNQVHPEVIITRTEQLPQKESVTNVTHENNVNINANSTNKFRPRHAKNKFRHQNFNEHRFAPPNSNSQPFRADGPSLRPPFPFQPQPFFPGPNNQFYGNNGISVPPQPQPIANLPIDNGAVFMQGQDGKWSQQQPQPHMQQVEQPFVVQNFQNPMQPPPFPGNFQHPDFLNFFPAMPMNQALPQNPNQFFMRPPAQFGDQQQFQMQFNFPTIPSQQQAPLAPPQFMNTAFPPPPQAQPAPPPAYYNPPDFGNINVENNKRHQYNQQQQQPYNYQYQNKVEEFINKNKNAEAERERPVQGRLYQREREVRSPAKRRVDDSDDEQYYREQRQRPRLHDRLGPPPDNSKNKEAEIVKIINATKKELGIGQDDEYLKKIEEQKRKRAEILRLKEERRKGIKNDSARERSNRDKPQDADKSLKNAQGASQSSDGGPKQSIHLNPKAFNGDLLNALNTNLRKINMNVASVPSKLPEPPLTVKSAVSTSAKPGTSHTNNPVPEKVPSVKKGKTILRVVKNKKGEIISKSKVVIMKSQHLPK